MSAYHMHRTARRESDERLIILFADEGKPALELVPHVNAEGLPAGRLWAWPGGRWYKDIDVREVALMRGWQVHQVTR